MSVILWFTFMHIMATYNSFKLYNNVCKNHLELPHLQLHVFRFIDPESLAAHIL